MNPRARYYQAKKEAIKALSKNGQCLFHTPNSCGKPINSHSITESRLRKISTNGKLYVFSQVEFQDIENIHNNRIIEVKDEGLSRISTYKGFCSQHDSSLFEVIDNSDVIPTYEQVQKFHFRILSYAYVTSQNSVDVFNNLLRIDNPYEEDEENFKIKKSPVNYAEGLQKDVRDHITNGFIEISDEIKSHSEQSLNHFFIRIDKIPEVMFSDILCPSLAIDGKELYGSNKLPSEDEYLSLTLSADNIGGYLLAVWNKKFRNIERFVDSIKNNSPPKLIPYVFSFINNIAFSIPWWDNLSVTKRKSLCHYNTSKYLRIIDPNEFNLLSNKIKNDHKKYVEWNYVST